MLKLKRYLKPFIWVLLLTFLLLFGQAMCDLSLPNYMSNIVNIGLQQNGIEEAAPEALSQKGLMFIENFMSEEEKELVRSGYTLKKGDEKDADGKEIQSLYPAAADGEIYVKTDRDHEEELDTAFGNASWTFVQVLQSMDSLPGVEALPSGDVSAPPSDPPEEESALGMEDLKLEQLYAMQPMLAQLPPGKLEAAQKAALATDEAFRKQSAVVFVRGFYEELGVDVSAIESSYVLRMGLVMLIVALLGGVATILVSLISSRVSSGVARNLRRDLFNKVESFSSGEFDQFSTASLITRSTNDITQIQLVLQFGIRVVCYAPIMGMGGILMALRKSPSMSWILALICIVLLTLVLTIFSVVMPRFKILQKLTDKLNLVSRESLSGLMVIRAFGTRKHEEARFDDANQELTKVNRFVNRVMVTMMPLMMLIMNGTALLIVWVGAHQVSQASMQVGDIMAFIQYAMHVIMSFLFISMMFVFVPRASVSAERIHEVLSTELSIYDPETPKPFDDAKKGTIEFKSVNFRYDGADEDVLHDISFTTKRGKTTAIIGPTGSGKSTVVNLIMRFYDVTAGQILVDGVDVREVSQKELRARIGYVPQKGILLSGTIDSNLRYGKPDADGEEVRQAAEVAQAAGFIGENEEGYDYEIAQGGSNVSGGQRQRLSIARALVKDPEFFIFDDSFSALDLKTDATLRKALKKHTGENTTTILVAQRVSTILQAEQILVLDDTGNLVGRGTHKELLKTCPAYYEIAASQLAKEELA